MSDLRDAVVSLAEAVERLAVASQGQFFGGVAEANAIARLANDARRIAQTVNGVAGKSDEPASCDCDPRHTATIGAQYQAGATPKESA